jgi:hypothetical protein
MPQPLIIPSPLAASGSEEPLARRGEGKSEGAVGSLEGETIVRQYQKIILALAIVFSFLLAGIAIIEPMKAYGQLKGKMGLSQESGRDPFLLPSGVRLLSKSDSALAAKGAPSKSETKLNDVSPPLIVKAILISDHIRLASIDRYIVTIGDTIHDEKVLEIKTDRVILGKGDKKRTLLLSQSPIRLIVEER